MRPATLALAAVAGLASAHAARGVIVYDNLTTAATAGYSEPAANNPTFGDALVLTSGGTLSSVGLSVFNSTSGSNTGAIITGTTVVKFYDNTTPYSGGAITNPLLGMATVTWDFTASPLAAGFFTLDEFDISSLNIVVPQNILVTQQFTMTSGTSTRNGIVLLSNPTVGTSPASVYISSSATAAGLYSFSGGNPNQLALRVQITPAPGAAGLAGIAGVVAFRRRRR